MAVNAGARSYEPGAADAWRTALLESSLDCVIVMDADGRIVDVNRVTETMFGRARAEVLGRRLAEVFVPEELREAHERGLARYRDTGESRLLGSRIEVPALHASGRRIPVELSVVRLHGSEPPLFVGHLRPIEEQKRREARLRAGAAAAQALAAHSAPDDAAVALLRAMGEELDWVAVQFWTVQHGGEAVQLTHAWARDPGSDAARACRSIATFARGLGLPGSVLAAGGPAWIEDMRGAVHLPRRNVLLAAGIRSAVCLPVRVHGTIVAVLEAFASVEQEPDPQLLALLDAIAGQLGHFIEEHTARTALAESEARLREALEREKAARLEAEEASRAKTQFLAVVSHELRTPLNPILGWARMLRSVRVPPDVMDRALEAIERNAELQAHLVEDLLDMTRIVAGKLVLAREPLDLVHVIHAGLEALRGVASEKGLGLEFEGPVELPLEGDPKRLQQVVTNLVGNAIKFTPPGGRVTITLRRTPDEVTLTVADTGAGISPEFLPHIFDAFRQADDGGVRHGGLGLGLAIVRDLVHAHGGTIAARSAGPGQGAEFTVRLPLH